MEKLLQKEAGTYERFRLKYLPNRRDLERDPAPLTLWVGQLYVRPALCGHRGRDFPSSAVIHFYLVPAPVKAYNKAKETGRKARVYYQQFGFRKTVKRGMEKLLQKEAGTNTMYSSSTCLKAWFVLPEM